MTGGRSIVVAAYLLIAIFVSGCGSEDFGPNGAVRGTVEVKSTGAKRTVVFAAPVNADTSEIVEVGVLQSFATEHFSNGSVDVDVLGAHEIDQGAGISTGPVCESLQDLAGRSHAVRMRIGKSGSAVARFSFQVKRPPHNVKHQFAGWVRTSSQKEVTEFRSPSFRLPGPYLTDKQYALGSCRR